MCDAGIFMKEKGKKVATREAITDGTKRKREEVE